MMVAFKILCFDDKAPVVFLRLKVYLVFDIKLDLTHKPQWVVDRHLTPNPFDGTYAGVVSRESIRIALDCALLVGLDLWAAVIMNDFVQAPTYN